MRWFDRDIRLIVTLAACAGASCTQPVGGEALGETVLHPEAGKADGSTSAVFQLSPVYTAAFFGIKCDEWFSCDLALRLEPSAQPELSGYIADIRVSSTRQVGSGELPVVVSADGSVAYGPVELDDELGVFPLWVEEDGAGRPFVRARSPDEDDRFLIAVSRRDWTGGPTHEWLQLSASWF